jgi:hypothetical protein
VAVPVPYRAHFLAYLRGIRRRYNATEYHHCNDRLSHFYLRLAELYKLIGFQSREKTKKLQKNFWRKIASAD